MTASNLAGQRGSVGDVLTPGETKSGLQIVLAAAVSVGGRVLDAGGVPAAGVVAEFIRGGARLFAETGADGRFEFPAIHAGAFTVAFSDPVGPGLARRTGTVVSQPIDFGDIVLDDAAPAVVESTPADGALGVVRTPEIRVRFSEAVDTATVNAQTVTLIGPAGAVTGLVDLIEGNAVVRFRMLPGVQLQDQARYTLRVTGVKDLVGRTMSGDFAASFTTEDLTPPSITETTPAAAATGVAVTTTIRVRYSEIIDPAKFTGPAIVVTGPSGAVEGRVDVVLGNTAVVFTPRFPLAEDATYQVQVAPATDLSGLRQPAGLTFAFSTTDRTPPSITSLVPSSPTVIENTLVQVTAAASVSDVAFVDFFVNGTLAFTSRSLPFTMALQASPQFGGPGSQLQISAVATDTSGNRGAASAPAVVTVIADQLPIASILAPVDGVSAPNGARVNVRVRGTDDVGVTQIGYLVRRTEGPAGPVVLDAQTQTFAATLDRTEDFAFNVPVDAAPGSLLTIEASVRDTSGRTQPAVAQVRVLDAVGPTVQITGLSSGERVQPGQVVTAVVSATDPGGVARIGFSTTGVVVRSEQRDVTPPQVSAATSFQFTVPASAQSTDRVIVNAFALDTSGNRSDAAQITLPLADKVAPTVTLRTADGTLDMVPGAPVTLVVEGTDDIGVAVVTLSVAGAFSYSNQFSFSAPATSGSRSFDVPVPAGLAPGATATFTARAVDTSSNVSAPALLTLTARVAGGVTLPDSLLLRAGESHQIDVTLDAPAPAGGVTVTLASSAPGLVTATPAVAFAAGETTKTAMVNALRGGTAQVSAAIGGIAKDSLTVTVIGGVVTGTVVAPVPEGGFAPVAGATVTVFHAGTPKVTQSAADGTFAVEGVTGTGFAGRDISVRASDPGRLDFKAIQLSAPDGYADVTMILLPLGSLRGTVLLADGVTPAGPNVLVRLFETAAPNVSIEEQFTDAGGGFSFPLLAPGSYFLIASQQNVDIGRANASVTSGEETVANVQALARGTVAITVLSAAGTAVPGAVVTFNSTSVLGGAPQRTATSDGDGKATFTNVLAGAFTAAASDPATGQGGSTSGQVVADGVTVSATITLSAYGNVTGTVYRTDGTTSVPGATVTASCGGTCRYTSTADANGHYSFLFLPIRSYTMFASEPGTRGQGVNQSVVSFTASGETITRDISLAPQGALLATVLDADGQPVSGAQVSVQVAAPPLSDSLSGTTGIVDGQPGRVLLDRLLAGPYTVSASAAGLSGAGAPGTIVAGEVATATIQLEPTGSITVTVLGQDGQTPAAGSVRINGGAPLALVNGEVTAANLPLGTYAVEAFDTGGRRRAFVGGVVLAANGDHPAVNLTFVALGTVRGRVIHPTVGGDVGNLTVTLQSLNPSFGGFRYAQTDAAGNYEVTGVAVGAVRVTAGKPAEQLLGEATGSLVYTPPAPAELSLDVLLQSNSITLPISLADANGAGYSIGQSGGLGGSNVRTFNYGGLRLTLTPSGGAATEFTGATVGTKEDADREIAVRQDNVTGLNVTRKVFVPTTGYFARYLELLSNPTDQPITVDVEVASRLDGGRNPYCSFRCLRTHYLSATSSGDGVLDVSSATPDRWASFGAGYDPFVNSSEAASVGFVFDGEGGSVHVGSAVWDSLDPNLPPYEFPLLRYAWQSVTVPAGGTIGLMHFVSLQAHQGAATASAERLAQLPPEALEGLSASEIAAIANFAVPASGTSEVAPLPPITGQVTGQVREGDNVSPVPGAAVTFESSVLMYPRRFTFTADGSGNFSKVGGAGAPVPVADFSLFATYPGTQIPSQTDTVSFPTGQSVATHDIVFRDFGIIAGTVRRNGLPVAGATVQVGSRSTSTDAAGRYYLGAMSGRWCVWNEQTQQCDYVPASYTLSGYVNHAQGTALALVSRTVQLSAGQSLQDIDLTVEPTGTVAGVLLDAAGTPQGSRQVRLRNGDASYQRFVTTSAAGEFAFADVRLGSFTVASTDPNNNLETTVPVTVAENQTTTVELRYAGNVTITVLVTRANGTPLGGMSVQVTGTGFSRPVVATNASGIATVTDVPAGRSATAAAFHPLQSSALRTTKTFTTGPNQQLTLALPAFGSVSGTVRRPNGALVGPGVRVNVSNGTGAPSFYYSLFTDASSRYQTDLATQPVPAMVNVSVTAERPEPLSNGYTKPTLTFPNNRIPADGQTLAVDVRTPAVATVRFTITENGSPVAGARVFQMHSNGYSEVLQGATDGAGQLTTLEVVEGTYAYRIRRPAGNNELLDVASVAVGPADDGGTVNVTVDARRYNITVRGTLYQADGVTPLPSPVQVELLRAADRVSLASTCVGGLEACSTPGLAPGEFRFTSFDAVQATWNQGSGIATGAGVIVRVRSPFYQYESPVQEQLVLPTANGEYIANFTVPVLQATVTGQVFAADGTTPVGTGFVVADFVDNATTRVSGPTAAVRPDGTFSFEGLFLPPEGARLKLFDYEGLANRGVYALTGPVATIGQTLSVTMTLPPSTYATVRGRVLAGDGITPLEAIYGEVQSSSGGTSGFSTDADGRFERKVIVEADGSLKLRVRHLNASVYTEVERTATTQGQDVDFGDITLPISVVQGTVTYAGGTPVQSLSVFARGSDDWTQYPWKVDSETGTYVFYGLSAGEYTVTANDDIGQEKSIQVTLATDGSVVMNADIQLPAITTLAIDVLDRNGQPAQYANVIVRSGPDFELQRGWFAGDGEGGSFEVVVPAGQVTVEAEVLTCGDPDRGETCTGESRSITVDATEVLATIPVTVDLSELGSVGLFDVVTAPDGQPVTGSVEVSWRGQPHPTFLTPQRTEEVPPQEGGDTWLVRGVPPGPVRLAVRSGNFVGVADFVGPDPGDELWTGLTLSEGQRVRFTLLDDDDTPFANTTAYVIITSEFGERRFTATTDAEGHLVIEGLSGESPSTVRFLLEGWIELEGEVTPSGEETQDVEVKAPPVIFG